MKRSSSNRRAGRAGTYFEDSIVSSSLNVGISVASVSSRTSAWLPTAVSARGRRGSAARGRIARGATGGRVALRGDLRVVTGGAGSEPFAPSPARTGAGLRGVRPTRAGALTFAELLDARREGLAAMGAGAAGAAAAVRRARAVLAAGAGGAEGTALARPFAGMAKYRERACQRQDENAARGARCEPRTRPLFCRASLGRNGGRFGAGDHRSAGRVEPGG